MVLLEPFGVEDGFLKEISNNELILKIEHKRHRFANTEGSRNRIEKKHLVHY